MKKSEIFGIIVSAVLVVMLYLNIGCHYVEVLKMSINNAHPFQSESQIVNEIFIVGRNYSIVPSGIDFVGVALILAFWPIVLFISLGSWILWIFLGGGLNVFIGIELVCFFFIILLGVLGYIIFRKRKK